MTHPRRLSEHGKSNLELTSNPHNWVLYHAPSNRHTYAIVLRARIDREATGTTLVYIPIAGLFTRIAILDHTFLEAYPIHVRRKHFFNAHQKEGQSAIDLEKSFSPNSRKLTV